MPGLTVAQPWCCSVWVRCLLVCAAWTILMGTSAATLHTLHITYILTRDCGDTSHNTPYCCLNLSPGVCWHSIMVDVFLTKCLHIMHFRWRKWLQGSSPSAVFVYQVCTLIQHTRYKFAPPQDKLNTRGPLCGLNSCIKTLSGFQQL